MEVSSPDESSASPSWPDNDAIRYLPAPGFSGVETITYTVSDENGGTVQGTVTVDIEDRNEVVRYRLEARDGAGHVVDHVRPGDMVDVYVFAKDQSGLDTEGIVWAASSVTYDSKQIELVATFNSEKETRRTCSGGGMASSPRLRISHSSWFPGGRGFQPPHLNRAARGSFSDEGCRRRCCAAGVSANTNRSDARQRLSDPL